METERATPACWWSLDIQGNVIKPFLAEAPELDKNLIITPIKVQRVSILRNMQSPRSSECAGLMTPLKVNGSGGDGNTENLKSC
jgi:hypothetical protein